MTCKFTARQTKKWINKTTKKIAYEFEFLHDGKPIVIGYSKMVKTTDGRTPDLDENSKMQWIDIPAYRKVQLEFDPGTAPSTIKGILRRQLLELELQSKCKEPKLEEGLDVDEVTLNG